MLGSAQWLGVGATNMDYRTRRPFRFYERSAMNDDAYFHQRAETELAQARHATNAAAAAAHYQLAEAYLAKLPPASGPACTS